MSLIDTHAHLDFEQFDTDRDAVLERAAAAGVDRLITVGTTLARSRRAVQLAEHYDTVWATVGIHPADADQLEADAVDSLRELVKHPRTVAVGEIGFDFFHDANPPEDVQRAAFFAQSELAWRHKLPIIVHSRSAEAVTVKALKQHAKEAQAASIFRGEFGVVHCFTSTLEFAQQVLELGYLISFTAPVGYPKNDVLREVVKQVPLEKLMLETDCPFLPPADKRGKRNEPAYLLETARVVADLKGVSLDELAKVTTANAERLFGLA